MTPLDLTLAAVTLHGWKIVLLRPREKRPTGKHWQITQDLDFIRRHVEQGGNLGLLCGSESGVAVFDFDDLDLMKEMFDALGTLPVWVTTGSGKPHCYLRWENDLPAKLLWNGTKVGEIQRGPGQQQVVMPPSIHPDTGREYRWLIDPCEPLPTLPGAWRSHLLARPGGNHPGVSGGDRPGVSGGDDQGPPPEVLLAIALQQPGAQRRTGGIKFQCPACRDEGHDRHKDNALLRIDGTWGCAVNPDHSRAIGDALGVTVPEPVPAIPGYDTRVLRRLGFRL